MPCGTYYYGDCAQVRNFESMLKDSKKGFRGCGIISGRESWAEEVARKIRIRQEEKRRKEEKPLDYQI